MSPHRHIHSSEKLELTGLSTRRVMGYTPSTVLRHSTFEGCGLPVLLAVQLEEHRSCKKQEICVCFNFEPFDHVLRGGYRLWAAQVRPNTTTTILLGLEPLPLPLTYLTWYGDKVENKVKGTPSRGFRTCCLAVGWFLPLKKILNIICQSWHHK